MVDELLGKVNQSEFLYSFLSGLYPFLIFEQITKGSVSW